MDSWPSAGTSLFNPAPTIHSIPLGQGAYCHVIDGALVDPEGLVRWAQTQVFRPARGYPYPGLVAEAPAAVVPRMTDYFAQHLRKPLGARRLLDLNSRLSLVTAPPTQLDPCQWQCHRDRIAADPDQMLFAASVLYLFRDPALGGTSFYAPRQSAAETERLVQDSQDMDAAQFSARYGLQAGYMLGSNAYFELIASVPAAWNRMIFYDGGLFHSADITHLAPRCADPAQGRLTLNAFLTCRRNAR